eukprot:ANDGO_01281.mRNA.1 hypothetical protein
MPECVEESEAPGRVTTQRISDLLFRDGPVPMFGADCIPMEIRQWIARESADVRSSATLANLQHIKPPYSKQILISYKDDLVSLSYQVNVNPDHEISIILMGCQLIRDKTGGFPVNCFGMLRAGMDRTEVECALGISRGDLATVKVVGGKESWNAGIEFGGPVGFFAMEVDLEKLEHPVASSMSDRRMVLTCRFDKPEPAEKLDVIVLHRKASTFLPDPFPFPPLYATAIRHTWPATMIPFVDIHVVSYGGNDWIMTHGLCRYPLPEISDIPQYTPFAELVFFVKNFETKQHHLDVVREAVLNIVFSRPVIDVGAVIPNPSKTPLVPGTDLCHLLFLAAPVSPPWTVALQDRPVKLLWVTPITTPELLLVYSPGGFDQLMELFDKHEHSPLFDAARPLNNDTSLSCMRKYT